MRAGRKNLFLGMKLNWNNIVSNAVTVLVATVFVGAGSYLWHGVQTVDQRIDKNLSSIRATQSVIAPKVDKLEEAIQELVEHHRQLSHSTQETNRTQTDDGLEFNFGDKPTIDEIQFSTEQIQHIEK